MPPDAFTLAELSRLADVTPRTVRYYIGQGLLPSPGAGPQARYTDGHLARLRLIRRLQREHLPLAEIRRRLEGLPDDVVSSVAEADAAAPPALADTAADYVRRLLARPQGTTSTVPPPQPPPASIVPPPSPEPERTTWERHAVTPDVEIHVRRPLDRYTGKQVDRLIRIARELLADEP